MISPRAVACLLALLTTSLVAAEKPAGPLRLWPKKAPGALGEEGKDTPTITPYWPAPERASGAAFIVCPGGGYRVLAPHEEEPFAQWLASQGIAAFVLKYRLTVDGYRVPTILLDAARS